MNWKQEPTMECPSCKEIEFEHVDTLVGQGKETLEYVCGSCSEIGFFDAPLPKTKTMAIAWTVPNPAAENELNELAEQKHQEWQTAIDADEEEINGQVNY